MVPALQSAHYPDRTKIGILWGVEEMIGQWFQGTSSLASVGAARPTQSAANSAGSGYARDLASCDNVFLLETTGPMRLAQLPVAGTADVKSWASFCLPGLEEHAMRLVEIIYTFDVEKVAQSLEIQLPSTSSSLARFASLSSLSNWEHAFVLLRGRELRLAVHSVGSRRLLFLSGDALKHRENHWDWWADSHNLSASGRALQRKEDLQHALRRSDFQKLLGDPCGNADEPTFQDL